VREAAVKVLGRQLDALLAGRAPRTPQNHALATYFGKRTPEDGRIDWTISARQIFNLVRAVTRPFPGAFTDITRQGAPHRLLIWRGRPSKVQTNGPRQPPGQILSFEPLVFSCGQGRHSKLLNMNMLKIKGATPNRLWILNFLLNYP